MALVLHAKACIVVLVPSENEDAPADLLATTERTEMNYDSTHDTAIRKARRMAEEARPALTDHEFWNNDYTDDMIAIIRDPSFMTKSTFFADALTDADRDFCASYLISCREFDERSRAA